MLDFLRILLQLLEENAPYAVKYGREFQMANKDGELILKVISKSGSKWNLIITHSATNWEVH